MLRSPRGQGARGDAGTAVRAMAAPDWPALREGARRPPRCPAGPPGPHVHPAPGLLRAAAAEEEASAAGAMAREREGEAPRGARARGSRATPPGALSGAGKGPGGGAVGRGPQALGARRGLGLSPGRSRLPGGGVVGRPGPTAPQHKRAPDAEPPGAREGGRGGRAAWQPPGRASRLVTGRGQPSDTPPQTGPLRPPSRPFRDPGPRLPGDPGRGAGPEVSAPSPLPHRAEPTSPSPTSARGQGRGHEIGPFARGRGFPSGSKAEASRTGTG